MDDLELPRDRANLSLFSNKFGTELPAKVTKNDGMMARFEIIDSDGSGTLQVVELVQALLKIRGEAGEAAHVGEPCHSSFIPVL